MKDFETGEILDGKYEVLSLLGKGGMGRVYRARQINLDRPVAVKVPSETVLNNEEYIERFLREAQTCARIAHEHIVAIYDVHEGPVPYIVMEYVDGMQLNHFLHERSRLLAVGDLVVVMGQIASGLAAAHNRGIVHRDIKPANIFITRESQRVKIMDFGIARVEGLTSLTMTGAMMGTPFYMAPEQIRGGNVGPATDIYALACLAYQLFSGRLVFDGKIPELIFKHVNEEPIPPSCVNPRLPRPFDTVILKALSKKPELRHQSATEFYAALAESLGAILDMSLPALAGKAEPSERPLSAPGGPARSDIAAGKRPAHAAVGPTEILMPSSRGSEASPAEVALVPPLPPSVSGRPAGTGRFLLGFGAAAIVLLGGLIAWQMGFKRGDSEDSRFDNGRRASPGRSGSEIRLRWAAPEVAPRESYRRGEYLTAWWLSDPAPSSLSPRVYRVSIIDKTSGAKTDIRARTTQERIALRLDRPSGEYRLTVVPEEEAGASAAPLDADFSIAEK